MKINVTQSSKFETLVILLKNTIIPELKMRMMFLCTFNYLQCLLNVTLAY